MYLETFPVEYYTFRYDFIAIGVGDGKDEDLESFAYRGVTYIDNYLQLNEKSIFVKPKSKYL